MLQKQELLYNNLMIEANLQFQSESPNKNIEIPLIQDNEASELIKRQHIEDDEQHFQEYQMDPEYLLELSKYKNQINAQEKGQISKIYKSISIMQATVLALYLINFLFDSAKKTIVAYLFLCLTSSLYIVWMIFIERRKHNMYKVDILLCIELELGFIVGLLSIFVNLRFPLIITYVSALVIKCCYFSINNKGQLREQINFSLMSIGFGLSGFVIMLAVSDLQMLEGRIVGLVGIVVFGFLFIPIISFFSFNFFIISFWLYLISLGFFFSLSAAIQAKNAWIYLTQITNTLFSIITIIFLNKSLIKSKQKFFPISRSLLTSDRNNPNRLTKKLTLEACTVCLSEESKFCYKECMHTCCGYRCIVSWLKNGKRLCPLCRKKSNEIVELRRVGDGEFQIGQTYRMRIIL